MNNDEKWVFFSYDRISHFIVIETPLKASLLIDFHHAQNVCLTHLESFGGARNPAILATLSWPPKHELWRIDGIEKDLKWEQTFRFFFVMVVVRVHSVISSSVSDPDMLAVVVVVVFPLPKCVYYVSQIWHQAFISSHNSNTSHFTDTSKYFSTAFFFVSRLFFCWIFFSIIRFVWKCVRWNCVNFLCVFEFNSPQQEQTQFQIDSSLKSSEHGTRDQLNKIRWTLFWSPVDRIQADCFIWCDQTQWQWLMLSIVCDDTHRINISNSAFPDNKIRRTQQRI